MTIIKIVLFSLSNHRIQSCVLSGLESVKGAVRKGMKYLS